MMWSKGAPSSHRSWATTWPTLWRACRPILWSATRRRYSLTHISSNLLLLLGRGDIWLTWPHTRWSQRSAPLENEQPSRDRRLDRNASGCSRRQRIRSPGLTTTITASPATPQSHKTDSTLGYSRARVQQCLTRPFPSLSGADLCTSPTRSLSWTTGAPGFARLVDISRAYVPSSSLNLARVFFPKWAGEI